MAKLRNEENSNSDGQETIAYTHEYLFVRLMHELLRGVDKRTIVEKTVHKSTLHKQIAMCHMSDFGI